MSDIANPLNDPRSDAFGRDTRRVKQLIYGAMQVALRNQEYSPLEFAYALAEMAASPGTVKKFAEYGARTFIETAR